MPRAKAVSNLGAASALDPKVAYKRSYFIDWPLPTGTKLPSCPRLIG